MSAQIPFPSRLAALSRLDQAYAEAAEAEREWARARRSTAIEAADVRKRLIATKQAVGEALRAI